MADFAVCFARNFTSWILMTGARVLVWFGSLEAKVTCRDVTSQQRSCHSILHQSGAFSPVSLCSLQFEKYFSG